MELPFIDKIERAADKIKDNTGIRLEEWPVFIAALILLVVSYIFMPNVVKFAASAALFLLPVWFPFLVLSGAVALWVILKRGEFLDSTKYVLLEIKLPRNIVKTPLAMEAFLSTLHISGGESNWFLVWIKGSVRPFWSLEIASFGGQVHFYIWTRVMFRKVVESQLYAQYPGVQLVEVPDYTMSMNLEPDTFGTGIWGCDFKHTAEDPLPIKTYVEYGLDKIQKEPEQTDPLSNLIEYMSSIN